MKTPRYRYRFSTHSSENEKISSYLSRYQSFLGFEYDFDVNTLNAREWVWGAGGLKSLVSYSPVQTPRGEYDFQDVSELVSKILDFIEVFGWDDLKNIQQAASSLWNVLETLRSVDHKTRPEILELTLHKLWPDYIIVLEAFEEDESILTGRKTERHIASDAEMRRRREELEQEIEVEREATRFRNAGVNLKDSGGSV